MPIKYVNTRTISGRRHLKLITLVASEEGPYGTGFEGYKKDWLFLIYPFTIWIFYIELVLPFKNENNE